jgi:hypothetical protein
VFFVVTGSRFGSGAGRPYPRRGRCWPGIFFPIGEIRPLLEQLFQSLFQSPFIQQVHDCAI